MTTNSDRCEYLDCKSINYYCDTVEINVRESGYYTIKSNSTQYMSGFIYDQNNIIEMERWIHSWSNRKIFEYFVYHERNTSVILIMISQKEDERNNFSLVVSGPSQVNIKHLGKNL